VFVDHEDTFVRALRRPLDMHHTTEIVVGMAHTSTSGIVDNVIMEEEQEVLGARFLLRLLKL
jgi:hypothetical protein